MVMVSIVETPRWPPEQSMMKDSITKNVMRATPRTMARLLWLGIKVSSVKYFNTTLFILQNKAPINKVKLNTE